MSALETGGNGPLPRYREIEILSTEEAFQNATAASGQEILAAP